MSEFLKFFDDKVKDYPMHMEIYYSKITDWCINIYKKGCDKDGGDLGIVNIQDCDKVLGVYDM